MFFSEAFSRSGLQPPRFEQPLLTSSVGKLAKSVTAGAMCKRCSYGIHTHHSYTSNTDLQRCTPALRQLESARGDRPSETAPVHWQVDQAKLNTCTLNAFCQKVYLGFPSASKSRRGVFLSKSPWVSLYTNGGFSLLPSTFHLKSGG